MKRIQVFVVAQIVALTGGIFTLAILRMSNSLADYVVLATIGLVAILITRMAVLSALE